MVKKPFKGDYLTFEVRASYDKKTGSIHLTSKDKDILKENGFHLTLDEGTNSEYALRTLLEKRGMIPEEYLPGKASYGDSALHHVWDQFPLGVHADDTEAAWDSSASPNLLLIGGRGAGKSIIQRSILFHCIQNSDSWRVIIIDPLRVEFAPYKKYSPTVMDVVSSISEGVEKLRYAHGEMMKRYETLERLGLNNFRDMPEPPKSLMVMIDEANWFLTPVESRIKAHLDENELREEAVQLLVDIARLGRAAGVQFVLSSQQLDTDALTGELLINCQTRVTSGPLSFAQSEALLGGNQATRINKAIKGRGYFQQQGEGADFQAYFAPSDFLSDPTG
jgi:hypothetical protein